MVASHMFRAGLIAFHRMIFALLLLILLVCGAEVGVRAYEAVSGDPVCQQNSVLCHDPAKLTVPSWSFQHELKPLSTARVECRDMHESIEIRTNSLGLRGPEPLIPKPPQLFRVIVLGDETIYAPETPESDHFCKLLENRLQQVSRAKIEVINAGIPGHCPLTEYLLLKQRLLSLQPDLVVLHYDWSDASEDRQIRRFARCDDAGLPQSCPHASLVAARTTRKHEVWRSQFRLLDWGMSTAGDKWRQKIDAQKAASRDVDANPYAWLRDEHPQQNLMFRQSVRPILELSQLCRGSSCQFVLLTTPKPWQVSSKCSRGDGVRLEAGVSREACFSNREPFRALGRFAQKAGIPFIDGSVDLAGPDPESLFLRHAPRWTPKGHQLLAEHVGNVLIENLPGPWNTRQSPQTQQPVSRSGRNTIQWLGAQESPPDSSWRNRR